MTAGDAHDKQDWKAADAGFRLVVRPLPRRDDPDGTQRLRRLLKAMLRGYGLRCVRIEPADIKRKIENRHIDS